MLHHVSIPTFALAGILAMSGGAAAMDDNRAVADRAVEAFAEHCFNPRLTADRVDQVLQSTGARVDFYDLDPFSDVAPTPALGVALDATPGTDRRCELAFDGEYAERAAEAAVAALAREGIRTEASVPDTHTALPGTVLLAARQLNPTRVAVVHVGTRPGPNGIETFMNVERLLRSND